MNTVKQLVIIKGMPNTRKDFFKIRNASEFITTQNPKYKSYSINKKKIMK